MRVVFLLAASLAALCLVVARADTFNSDYREGITANMPHATNFPCDVHNEDDRSSKSKETNKNKNNSNGKSATVAKVTTKVFF